MLALALALSTTAFAQDTAPEEDGSSQDSASEDSTPEGDWGDPEAAPAPAPAPAPVAAPPAPPAPVAQPVATPAPAAPVVDPSVDEPEEWPIYVSARGSLAVPAGGLGQIPAGGLGIGVELDNGHTFGMRAIYMSNPPPNPISNSREIKSAWGPVLDYQFHIDNTRRLNFYPSLALGFVYSAEDGKENVILPIFEAGFGARLTKKTSSGDRLYIQPELGVVPGALAPYSSLTVGMIFGAKDS